MVLVPGWMNASSRVQECAIQLLLMLSLHHCLAFEWSQKLHQAPSAIQAHLLPGIHWIWLISEALLSIVPQLSNRRKESSCHNCKSRLVECLVKMPTSLEALKLLSGHMLVVTLTSKPPNCDGDLLFMQEADGVEPDSRIYVGLMHGCSNHGRLEQARELFAAASQLPRKADAAPLHQHNALIKAECVAGNFAKARPPCIPHTKPAFCKMSAFDCHAKPTEEDTSFRLYLCADNQVDTFLAAGRILALNISLRHWCSSCVMTCLVWCSLQLLTFASSCLLYQLPIELCSIQSRLQSLLAGICCHVARHDCTKAPRALHDSWEWMRPVHQPLIHAGPKHTTSFASFFMTFEEPLERAE